MPKAIPVGRQEAQVPPSGGNIDDILRFLYEIACRLQNIEYYSMRTALPNMGSIDKLYVLSVGTTNTVIFESPAIDTVVRVYNVSFDNPQILYVNTGATAIGIPINAGEYESFMVREGRKLFARYESTAADVVLATVNV